MSAEGNAIIANIKTLVDDSKLRGARLIKVRELTTAIGQLHDEIIEALRGLPNPERHKEELAAIARALGELSMQLRDTDTGNDELIKSIVDNANKLIAIREGIPGSKPSVIAPKLRGLIQDDSRPIPSALSRSDSSFSEDDSGDEGWRGGYKHSKRNSRKYMVKRFRSSRMSLKRTRKRRRKTLRRKPRRK